MGLWVIEKPKKTVNLTSAVEKHKQQKISKQLVKKYALETTDEWKAQQAAIEQQKIEKEKARIKAAQDAETARETAIIAQKEEAAQKAIEAAQEKAARKAAQKEKAARKAAHKKAAQNPILTDAAVIIAAAHLFIPEMKPKTIVKNVNRLSGQPSALPRPHPTPSPSV
jgi:hypothetical protein